MLRRADISSMAATGALARPYPPTESCAEAHCGVERVQPAILQCGLWKVFGFQRPFQRRPYAKSSPAFRLALTRAFASRSMSTMPSSPDFKRPPFRRRTLRRRDRP